MVCSDDKMLIAIAESALNCAKIARESAKHLLLERSKEIFILRDQLSQQTLRNKSFCSLLSEILIEARMHGCIRHKTAVRIELALNDSLK